MNFETLLNYEPELGKNIIVIDGEISKTIDDPKLWQTPWKLPVSVFCTIDDKRGFRDWIGDQSIAPLIKYLMKFDVIVGFNQIQFDCGVMDGAVAREFNLGGKSTKRVRNALEGIYDVGTDDPEPGMVKHILRGRSVDLNLDVQRFLDNKGYTRKGRRANLNSISKGMLYTSKLSSRFDGGAGAPKAWRQRLCLEVNLYCRMDVWLTAEIYKRLLKGESLQLVDWPEDNKINKIEGKVALKLR